MRREGVPRNLVPVFALDSADRRASRFNDAVRLVACAAQGLARPFLAEQRRWFLWLPVCEGLGIILYFTRLTEPVWWSGLGMLALTLAAWWTAARGTAAPRPAIAAAALATAAIAAGFTAAQWQSWRVQAPVLNQATPALRFQGTVGDIEILPQACRILVEHPVIEDLLDTETPHRIRLKLKSCPAAIGDQIWGRALLFPVPAPFLPGGYDFQRQDYFEGIGATGFTVGWLGEASGSESQKPDWLLDLRHRITARILTVLPNAEGGVAAALITGEKEGIPAPVAQDFRDSGLAHMLVIAGLHMTLVAGFVFFACRAMLALIPRIALHYPIKKFAALASLTAALIYLALSGGAVPTERAFVMCTLGIIAILFDRAVFSMRGLALAALAILTTNPVALMGVSFQMSFAAVVGLISFYESSALRLSSLGIEAGLARRAGLHLFGIALTTLVATIGTIPFTIYHFGRVALYSVLANVIAVPLAGFWILPWGFVACLLMPLHLEALALHPMGWGIGIVIAVAHWTASLPSDLLILPAMPDLALGLISFGGLWLSLWRRQWRWLGMLPIAAGFAIMPFSPPPDIFIADDGRLAAIRSGDGQLYLSSLRHDRMAAETWDSAAGLRATAPLPDTGVIPASRGSWDCADDTCVWNFGSKRVILERAPLDPEADCPKADLILSGYPVPPACRNGPIIVDPISARETGAETIWLGDRLRVRQTATERGVRPWIPVSSAASAPPAGPGP